MEYFVTRYDFDGDKARARKAVSFKTPEEAKSYAENVREAIRYWGDDSGVTITHSAGQNIP